MFFYNWTDIDMSRLENGLKVTVLTQSANFSSWHPEVTGCTISVPKSYDEHPRQVKYGSPPPPPSGAFTTVGGRERIQ